MTGPGRVAGPRSEITGEAGTTRHERLVLTTLCLGMFMAMLDNVVVSNALPRIDAELHTGIVGMQWVVEGYSLCFAGLLFVGGSLGDRWGRRRLYLGGLALFTLGSALTALAGTLEALVAGRVVQGVGAAALIPQSLAVLRVTYPDLARQARAFAVWSSVSALGLALGPAIGGPLVEAFGWPSAFWINVPIGLVALAIGFRAIPETRGQGAQPSAWAQGALAVAVAASVYALVEAPVRGWTSANVLGGAALLAVAAVTAVAAERRASVPAVDRSLLRDRVVLGAVLAGFVVTFGMFGVLTFLGVFMQDVLKWSPTGAGIASLPSTVLIIVMSPIASRLTLRFGPRRPLIAGLLCCAAGLAFLSLFGTDADYLQYCWALPLLGIGMGLCYTPVTITVMTRVPLERAGNASAVTNVSRELGGVAGIAVMGLLITTRLRSSLDDRLAHAGAPGGVVEQVRRAVTTGGGQGLAPSGSVPPGIGDAVAHAFVDGLHLALWCAAAFMIAGGVVIARLTRPGS
ncbi:MFS transporter [Microbispora sp. NPDC049125]|uniref:MFS transporter n=1 Tax=Microbispora sp. NPDC049125 TaxID=3154929 RepID=UPI003466A1D5